MVAIAVIVAGTTAQVSPFPLVAILEGLAALVTILGAVLFLWRQTKDQRVRNERFDRDWYGEIIRPGVPARPGVMEQLLTLRVDVESIKAEVNYNHGGSIKDVVDGTRDEVRALAVDVKGLHDRLDAANVHP